MFALTHNSRADRESLASLYARKIKYFSISKCYTITLYKHFYVVNKAKIFS